MPSFIELQKAKIAASYNTDPIASELTKAEILDIEKGGKRAMIGEKRTFAGREYIKTADGWKFHGKGGGAKAQEHVKGALEHHVESGKSEKNTLKVGKEELTRTSSLLSLYKEMKNDPEKYKEAIALMDAKGSNWDKVNRIELAKLISSANETSSKKPDVDSAYEKLTGKKADESDEGTASIKKQALKIMQANGGKDIKLSDFTVKQARQVIKEHELKSSKSHKDATDHFMEEGGKHYIDTLDPDSGETKFKPGDKVKYKDDSGKEHKGTISDREHEDGDMFEVDREESK